MGREDYRNIIEKQNAIKWLSDDFITSETKMTRKLHLEICTIFGNHGVENIQKK